MWNLDIYFNVAILFLQSNVCQLILFPLINWACIVLLFERGERDDMVKTINLQPMWSKSLIHQYTRTKIHLKVLWFLSEEGERGDRIETIQKYNLSQKCKYKTQKYKYQETAKSLVVCVWGGGERWQDRDDSSSSCPYRTVHNGRMSPIDRCIQPICSKNTNN